MCIHFYLSDEASRDTDDDWACCEAVVAALSVRYRFSRVNAVQLLREEGILCPRVAADDDVEEEDE